MSFINDGDPNENFIDDGNIDYSNSASFEVVEETKVSHGMFVASRQVADTFFHQIVPSQTVEVQLNPVMGNNCSIDSAETLMILKHQESFLREFKAYVIGKLMKPSNIIASAIVFIFALLLMLRGHWKEQVENWTPDSYDVKKKRCCGANNMKRMRQLADKIIWNEQEKTWCVGIKSGKGFSVVLKKIGIFLSISLALCTMWANHAIVNP